MIASLLTAILAGVGLVFTALGLLLRLGSDDEPASAPTLLPDERAAGYPDVIWYSADRLRVEEPDKSSHRTLSLAQKQVLVVGLASLGLMLIISWNLTLVFLIGVVTVFYFGAVAVRLVLFVRALNGRGSTVVSDVRAASYPEDQLPTYTVLVPAYGEPEIMHRLVPNLKALDYPREKLEILLLLEADDSPTIEAAQELVDSADVTLRIVLVPDYGPRTKPKALNYGLYLSSGEIVTIYDAEDRPEPLQLRKAAIALAEAPPTVACVQARLDFFNPLQNLITKWFTLDYRMWFQQLLPGLVQIGAPIPLGGTSNHFRREALLEVGAWDAHNVTEDADLGVRLYRRGYTTGVLDAVTLEEANSDFVNWVKQRSRWYKGYVQTSFVHLRHPAALYRDLGRRGFVLFVLFVAGTPAMAALNPLFWVASIAWFVWQPPVIHQLLPTFTYFVGQTAWVAGNGLVLYTWLLSTRQPSERLWLAAILAPLYWIMMAAAAIKAFTQLLNAPSYWEKTQHGLDLDHAVTEPQPARDPMARAR